MIFSNCHRQVNAFNEITAKTLIDNEYSLILQDTSGHDLIECPPGAEMLNAKAHLSYDAAMVNIHKEVLHNAKYIVFIDNDFFMTDINHFQKYLNEFIEREFDFTCHFEYPGYYDENPTMLENSIHSVVDPKTYQNTLIKPEPHWENSYMIIRTELYNKLSADDVSHGRKWLHAMNKLGAKMGGHYCDYRLRYTHYGPEWFHIGNLMGSYGKVETRNYGSFDVTSKVESSRLGFMFLDNPTMPGLSDAIKLFGIDRCLKDWRDLSNGTCMENWRK